MPRPPAPRQHAILHNSLAVALANAKLQDVLVNSRVTMAAFPSLARAAIVRDARRNGAREATVRWRVGDWARANPPARHSVLARRALVLARGSRAGPTARAFNRPIRGASAPRARWISTRDHGANGVARGSGIVQRSGPRARGEWRAGARRIDRRCPVLPNATLMGPGSEVFANLMGPANRQGHGATRKVHAVNSPTSWGHPIARVMGPPPF